MHQHGQQPASPQALPGVTNIIAVGSGKGGVGKTTLSVNLALALAKLGHKVGLLDADVYGPNVPLMIGSSAQPRAVSNERIEPILAHGLKVISVGFLNPGDKPIIWRGPMLHQIIRQFLGSVEWGQLDYLVIDVPPGEGGPDRHGREHELLHLPSLQSRNRYLLSRRRGTNCPAVWRAFFGRHSAGSRTPQGGGYRQTRRARRRQHAPHQGSV